MAGTKDRPSSTEQEPAEGSRETIERELRRKDQEKRPGGKDRSQPTGDDEARATPKTG